MMLAGEGFFAGILHSAYSGTFILISLCMNGLESENEDIFYFGESPYEIYAAMCQFSVSVTKA